MPAHELNRARRSADKKFWRTFFTRWWGWAIVGVVVILLLLAAAGAWVATRGLEAKAELEEAIPLASTIQDAVLAGDVDTAIESAKSMAKHTELARENTSDPIWRSAEALPVIGPNLSAVRILAEQADSLAVDAIVPLSSLAPLLEGSALKPVDGALDLAPISDAVDTIDGASAALSASLVRVQAIDKGALLGPVSAAVTKLDKMLAKYEPTLRSASQLVDVIPDALGASAPRNYLLIFQNNGEVMPRGGTVGSMAQIHVENGRVELLEQSSPTNFPRRATPIIPVSDEDQRLWISLGRTAQNITETPSFSQSFDIAQAMWQEKFGVSIDGIISLDPVALSYIVTATGPITLPDGTLLTGDHLVQSLMSDVYVKYPNPKDQDSYYEAISETTFNSITAGNFDPAKLFEAVMKGAKEKRVLMWTSNPAEQALITGSVFAGEPIVATAATEGVGVYFRDYTPSKMAFYLNQKVAVSQASCPDTDTRKTRVTVTLLNTVAAAAARKLPIYVSEPNGLVKKGDIVVGIKVYGPEGSTFVGGESSALEKVSPATDGSYVVGDMRTQISPQGSTTVTFDFVSQGADLKKMQTDVTPVVNATALTVETVDCASF